MSSQTVTDYLTKQIFIEKNIVTYRSLSRELRIHVNAAKNELATYHSVAPYQSQAAYATYLLSGELLTSRVGSLFKDVDMDQEGSGEQGEFEDEGEEVIQTTVMLVNEMDLEGARSKFTHIDSIHVYSLAPSPIHDAGLICTPTDAIRAIDRGKQAAEVASIVGRVVGSNIMVPTARGIKVPHQPVAGPSKPKLSKPMRQPIVRKSTKEMVVPANGYKEKSIIVSDKSKEESPIAADKSKEKVKATGKLDFTKAKTKQATKQETTSEQLKEVINTSSSVVIGEKRKEKVEESRRGIKRSPSATISNSEDNGKLPIPVSKPPSEPSKTVRLKNRAVMSDSDEDDMPQHVKKSRSIRASKVMSSDEELDVETLMDIDDDRVMRVTREGATPVKDGEEESADDVLESEEKIEDDPLPEPRLRKRRVKKIIPVGSNGLKKKRVVKSRQTIDSKGYMIFEDYSSYESVNEGEEPESPALPKGKSKRKAMSSKNEDEVTTLASVPDVKPAKTGTTTSKDRKSAKSGAKGSKSGQPKQKKLANFFMASTKEKS